MNRWSEYIIQPGKEEDLRIPPESFQIRSRKEPSSKDSMNSRMYETQGAVTPQQQSKYHRMDPSADPMLHKTPAETAVLRSFPDATITLEEAREALRASQNNVKKAVDALFLKTRIPISAAEPVTFFDMAPLSSRTDRRDFRQSKPYDSTGPNLALNPFFDRYDPTRDPRNMIREVRSVVYETKEPDRGIKESERIRERSFMNRYTPENKEASKLTEWFDLPRPTIDNPEIVYRNQGQLPKMGSKV
jgi:hypothetical protein